MRAQFRSALEIRRDRAESSELRAMLRSWCASGHSSRAGERRHVGPGDYPGQVILGIDTSLGTGVAVVELDGVVRSQIESTDPRGHAEVIGGLIERALAEASVRPGDIE